MAAAAGGGTIANLQVQVGANVAGALLGFATLQGAISAVVGAVEGFVKAGIDMNAFLESSQLQFKTLIGSAAEASTHVKELSDLAAHTPFTFESVTVASRQLEVFGGTALDTIKNLTLLGDAAAATGAPIEQVTFWTGRLYANLQGGQPIGEATRWLQRMGVMSADARQELQHLQATGASGNEIWKAYADNLSGRFGGAMKEQEATWAGLTSTMSDTFKLLEGAVTSGLFTKLEVQMKEVNKQLGSDETQEGARKFGAAIGDVARITALGFHNLKDANDELARFIELRNRWLQGLQEMAPDPRPPSLIHPVDEEANRTLAMEKFGTLEAAEAHREYARALAAQQSAALGVVDADEDLTAAERKKAEAHRAAMEVARDETERILQYKGALGVVQQGLAAYRDETARANEATQNFAQEHAVAITKMVSNEEALALMRKHVQSENADPLADLRSKETAAMEQHQKDVEAATKRNQEQAIRNQNDALQAQGEAIRRSNEAIQQSIRKAYVQTADEAENAYRRILNAALPVANTLQQQIDEAINRQVRAGTAGTADAEKQLDDIRKQHLATLPDLVALDRQYADAQRDSRAADLAVAAAERDLQKALAASGGEQTFQTAALSHVVTAKKEAAEAAHDHAQALSAERSQAISDTNALKDLGGAAKDTADATADAVRTMQDLGGRGFDAMASGAGAASIAMDNLKAAVRSTQTELDRLQEQADRASMIGQQQGIAGQLNDLDVREQTLPLRQQLLPLEQQMDLLRLAREATTHKERQKQLDKDIADVQLKIDGIQTQIATKQRAGEARALDLERLTIPYQRDRLWMENRILDVKEQQLDVQMAINNAQRSLMPPSGVVQPPLLTLTESGWRATPQHSVNVNFNAPVYGSSDFDQRVKQAVETLDRTNNLRMTRYAPR